MANVGVFVPVSVVFPGTEADLASLGSLLGNLSRTDVLFWCARLNHVLTGQSDLTHRQRQSCGVHQLLTAEDVHLINRFAGERGGVDKVTVFFRGQLLEIIRWAALICEDHAADGTTLEDPEMRRTLSKVALIASEIWEKRVYGCALNLNEGLAAARERSIGPFRKGIEAGLREPELSQILGRGWQLFNSLIPALDPSFEGKFRAATNLTITDYYACWCALVTNLMKPGELGMIFDANTLGNTTQQPALVQRFLSLESQTADELRTALWGDMDPSKPSFHPSIYDYKPLRNRPLLRAADGRTTAIDPIFISDKLAVGPLFHVLKKSGQDSKRIFGVFGEAFEQYAQQILRRCFPEPKADIFDQLACGLRGRGKSGDEFEIDACLSYVTDLILFEIKGTWLREAEFGPDDSGSLLQSLRLQYAVSGETTKGIGQLIRVIRAISSGDWIGPHEEFRNVNRIVPVLIAHDSLLVSPGFGRFISSEFDSLIGLQEERQVAGGRKETVGTTSPIVITVEDLEMLEFSLEHFSLREVFLDYSAAIPDRSTSFHDFLASSSKYSGRIYGNRFLVETAMQPLRLALERIFSEPAST